MKKYLLLVVVMFFIPILVNAETCDMDKITIDSIVIESKSDSVNELTEATANGKDITLNLNMSEVGDSIKYKVIVQNESDDDYLLDSNSFNISSEFVEYSLSSDDNSNIVKARMSKVVYLDVQYANQVPAESFESGIYNDNKTMTVSLSTGNPKTSAQLLIIVLLPLFILSISLFIIFRKKKQIKIFLLFISIGILIPSTVYAVCKCEINITSSIEISEPRPDSVSFDEDSWETISKVAKRDDICDFYTVGETKVINMGDFGNHTIRVSNCSKPVECSRDDFSQTACGLVLEFADIITLHRMNADTYDGHQFGDGNNGGWPATELYSYVKNDIYNALPDDIKAVIQDTKVISGHSYINEDNFITNDKLYLLSRREIWNTSDTSTTDIPTRQLDYYHELGVTDSNYASAIKKYEDTAKYWWTRSTIDYDCDYFYWVEPFGKSNSGRTIYDYGISPAFKVG